MKKNENGFIIVGNEELVDWNEPNGEGCMASDKITKEGYKVGYMYREKPLENQPDSGWRFLAGNEDDKYSKDASNFHIFRINTICNYDKDIIPHIHSKIGSKFIRVNKTMFEIDDETKPIFIDKQ